MDERLQNRIKKLQALAERGIGGGVKNFERMDILFVA